LKLALAQGWSPHHAVGAPAGKGLVLAAADFAVPAAAQSLLLQLQLPHSRQMVLHALPLLLALQQGLLQLHVDCKHLHVLLLLVEQQLPVPHSAPYPRAPAALSKPLLNMLQQQDMQHPAARSRYEAAALLSCWLVTPE
jgi:hypothetical protein